LVKTGPAALTLTGTNTYSGGTTVNAGILAFGDSSLSTGPITLNGTSGLRWYNNTDDITTNGLQLADSAQATLDTNGNNVTLSGAISGGTNGGVLIKAGGGTLVLDGPVSYTGGTTVAGGDIFFSLASLPTTGSIKPTGGALQVAGAYTTVTAWLASHTIDPASMGALALTADSSENINMAGYPTLSLGAAAGTTVNYSGTLTPANPGTWYLGGGGGQITFSKLKLTGSTNVVLGDGDTGGLGKVIFPDSIDPTQTNTYTGTTTINGGLVVAPVLANGGQPSTIGESSSNASNLILNGGGIQYTGSGASTNRVFSLGLNGGILDASGTGPLQWTSTAAIGFAGGNGPRTLTLQGSNTGANTLALALSDDGGPTSLVMDGPGRWLVTGANKYSGGTDVDAGALVITNASAIPDNSAITIGAGGTFIFDPSAASSAPIVSAQSAVAAVPEPSTMVLLVVGAMLGGVAWRRSSIRRRVRSCRLAENLSGNRFGMGPENSPFRFPERLYNVKGRK
jgi:autotransporter-associated beta strand protein